MKKILSGNEANAREHGRGCGCGLRVSRDPIPKSWIILPGIPQSMRVGAQRESRVDVVAGVRMPFFAPCLKLSMSG